MPNNNSFSTASDLGVLGSEITPILGSVGTDDRNDFFKFTLTQNSNVSFNLTDLGPEPAQLEILGDVNGDGVFSSRTETIQSDTVSDGSTSTADRTINTPLSAGTYWARVVTWYDYQNSGYTLTAQAITRTEDNAEDPGSTFEAALDIGNLSELQTFSDTVGPTDRNDFYRFTLTENSNVSFNLTDLGPEPAQLEILGDVDGDGVFSSRTETIQSDTVADGSSSTADRAIITPLSAGAYWARVVTWYDYQNSGYTLTAQASVRTEDNTEDPGDTFTTARDIGNLSELQTFSDTVGPTDRNDFYKFILTENSNLSFNLTGLGPEPAQLEILGDVNGDGVFSSRTETIQSDTVADGSSSTADRAINTPLSTGTYWVRVVTSYDYQNSGYTLTAQATPRTQDNTEDPGSTFEAALDIGNLSELQTFSDTVGPTDRNDFYKFTLTENSSVSFNLTDLGPEPAQLEILGDVNGDGVFSSRTETIQSDTVADGSSSTADRAIATPLSAGTYWARVVTWYDYQNSGYTLTAQAIPRTEDNAEDPGDTFATALDIGNLSELQTFSDTVGPTDRNDFYKFTLTQNSNVSFNLTNIGPEPAQMEILGDVNGDGVFSSRTETIQGDTVSDGSSSIADRAINTPLSAGTYWARVVTWYDYQNSGYTLTAQATPTSGTATDPGNQLADALDIGTLRDAQIFTETVGSLDRNDYYTFTLDQFGQVDFTLKDLQAPAQLSLLIDFDGNGIWDGGEDIASDTVYDSSNSTEARTLTKTLAPGAYWLDVWTQYSSQNTGYTLEVAEVSPLEIASDDPGNSLATAKDIGILSSNQTFTDFVGSRDRTDLYKFSLDQSSEVALLLNNLSEDAELSLILDANSDGEIDYREILSQTRLNDSSDRSFAYPLGVGDYFVRISTDYAQNNTPYTLSLSPTVLSIPDNAGATFSSARNLGALTGDQSFSDYVGSLIDPNDYYRFTLATDSSLSIDVDGEEGTDVRFEVYDSSENRFITSTDSTNLNLFSGDYYVRAFPQTGSTDYTLNFETISRVDQAGNSFDSARNIGVLTSGEQVFSDWVGSIDGNDYYRFELLDNSSVNLSLDGLEANANIVLLNETGRRVARSTNAGVVEDEIAVSDLTAGTYYLQVYQDASRTSTNYTVSLSATPEALTPFDVVSITPDTGSNTGQATVTITGAQFSSNAQVSLVDTSGNTRLATQLIWQNSSTVIGTFDLTGLEVGEYDISVVDTAGTETLPDVFTVVDGNGGQLEVTLSSPRAVRPWWTGEVVVSYRNVGDADIVAPLLSLTADNARFRSVGEDQFSESTIQFLGINGSGPAGVLPAGASGTATIAFQPTENTSEIDFSISTVEANETVDWAALKEGARPSNINGDAWDVIWGNFTLSVGDSAGAYQAVLAENATRLAQLGDRTSDVSQLLSFELQQSSDYQEIAQRYASGSLGRGQTFLGDLQLTVEDTGDVTIQNGTVQRTFATQLDGSYQAGSGDNGTLVAVGGSYQLTEREGTLTAFQEDGQLSYIEDTNGNRILATYTDQQLISLSDSTGGQLTFSYSGDRIVKVEDEVGRATTYTYDSTNEYITTVTNLSGTTIYTYDNSGAISTITDPENTTVQFDYDELGRLSQQSINSGEESISYSYDSAGGVTILETTGESRTQLLLNERGQIGQITDAQGRAIQYRYDDLGNLTRVIGPNNNTATFAYDEDNNITSQTDASGQQIQFDYESEFGQLAKVTDPRGNELRYEYDNRGNLEKILYEDDSLTEGI